MSYFHCIHILNEIIDILLRVTLLLAPPLKVPEEHLLYSLHVEAGGADGHRGEGQVGRWLGNVLWGGIRSSKTIEIRRSLTLSVVIVGFSRQLTTAMMDKYTERVKLNRK